MPGKRRRSVSSRPRSTPHPVPIRPRSSSSSVATPAAVAYRDLVFKQWWTRWQGRADTQGRCEVRAFYGKHQVKAGNQMTVVELKRAQETANVALK